MDEKSIATILYLIKKMEKVPGKKALQKITYFINTAVPLALDFKLYWFGPYSEKLASILDHLMIEGIIEVEEPNPYPMFHINKKYNDLVEDLISDTLSEEDKKKIDNIIKKIKDKTPMELELLATIHFIYSVFKELEESSDIKIKEKVLNTVKEKKGRKFKEIEIKKAYEFLHENGLI